MNGFRLILILVVFLSGFGLQAQSVLPPLKPNVVAADLINKALETMEAQYKINPSQALENKMDLYSLASGFLSEPSVIPTTTEYALTSAFLNAEVDRNQIPDTEAFIRFQNRRWNQDFLDLINLVKQ